MLKVTHDTDPEWSEIKIITMEDICNLRQYKITIEYVITPQASQTISKKSMKHYLTPHSNLQRLLPGNEDKGLISWWKAE